MWEVFGDVHQSLMNWANSGRTNDSELDSAMRVARSIGRISNKSMDDLTDSIESLKNSDDSNWEDLYMDTEDKLADAMAEFDD